MKTHVLRPNEDAAEVARSAAADVLGIAGGDGSLGPVAAIAIARGLPFVCVPYGTRNHFARDVGLDPKDPIAALDAFDGEERRIDFGRVGDRIFLNNVSLGWYAQLVHRREAHRRRRRALASARALWLVARHRDNLQVTVDDAPVAARVLLVANNAYELDLFDIGARPSLTEGRLHLYAAAGWLPATWEDRAAETFRVEAPEPLPAALDGEPLRLEPPLQFRIEPQALRLLAPLR